jgi:hypothetical protein
MDAGGGEPLGKHARVSAETVFHGSVEVLDEVAGFLDESAVGGGVGDVFEPVVGLVGLLATKGGEVIPQVLDKVRRQE